MLLIIRAFRFFLRALSSEWTGRISYYSSPRGRSGSGGGGYTSAAPIFLGLMAIAGAYLLKGERKK